MTKNKALKLPRLISGVLYLTIFLFCFMCFSKNVKAEEIKYIYEFDPDNRNSYSYSDPYATQIWENITLPENCEDPFLIIGMRRYWTGNNNVEWGDQSMTFATSTIPQTYVNGYDIFYLTNPSLGNEWLTITTSYNYATFGFLQLYCNIDQYNPVYDYFVPENFTNPTTVLLPENSWLIAFTNYSYENGIYDSTDNYLDEFWLNTNAGLATSNHFQASSTNHTFNFITANNANRTGYIVLNKTPDYEDFGTLTIPNFSCCENQDCYMPITYGDDLNDLHVLSGVDLPFCHEFATTDETILDFYTISPTSILISTSTDIGEHVACIIYESPDLTESVAQLKSFDTFASTTDQCQLQYGIATTSQWCSEEEVCGIATTSTSIWSGLDCIGKKLICWAFEPKKEALNTLNDKRNYLNTKFPFSLGNDFLKSYATIEEITIEATTTPTIKFLNSDIKIIDADQIRGLVGTSTAENARAFGGLVTYLAMAWAMYLSIKNLIV